MKKFFLLPFVALIASFCAYADGGMWLLQQMQGQYQQMKERGLELNALDLYNPDGSSIKDAVVMFDGGCSGVVVSDQGLILTNHHCGYDQIQYHSAVGHNYLEDGFWAQSFQEELVCPGLEVEMVDRIDDVTDKVLALLKKDKLENSLEALSPRHLATYVAQIVGKRAAAKSGYKYVIKAFYGGNKYYMFTNKVYSDVRFVAAPPSSIGKFGSDTDNWMWPRHTGDFSIFRIYADKNGNPAPYAASNQPLRPKRFVQVSTQGVQEGDFALIMGFPGTTYRFFTAPEVDSWAELVNKIRIEMRGIRQEVMLRHMLAEEAVNIQYAAKYAYSQNGYKRAQGANWAIKQRNLRASKLAQQEALLKWAKNHNKGDKYQEAVAQIEQLVKEKYPLHRHRVYLEEALVYPVEFLRIPLISSEAASGWSKPAVKTKELQRMQEKFAEFYNKDYNPQVDKDVTTAVLKRYVQQIAPEQQPAVLKQGVAQFGSVEQYVSFLFENSIYASREKFAQAIKVGDLRTFVSDPMAQLTASVWSTYETVMEELRAFNPAIASAQKVFTAGMLDMVGGEQLWPDANLTIRFTYGNVKGYKPSDNITYGHQTTLVGVMEKEDPNNWEYVVSPRLKEIFDRKDFGPYALPNGSMPVNFCATTHTTGGNSGSPVFNKRGELIGLNFDRNWEGVGGDIEYLPDYQRSIILDIRYLLLIVDKYGNCPRLLQEMNIKR